MFFTQKISMNYFLFTIHIWRSRGVCLIFAPTQPSSHVDGHVAQWHYQRGPGSSYRKGAGFGR